jgi:anaerobic selenocysteine-containing dehydrogenase
MASQRVDTALPATRASGRKPETRTAEIQYHERDSIQDIWGERTPFYETWAPRADIHVTETPERWVQSACVFCSTGCALDIGVKDGKIVGVRGRVADRVNLGRLGPKGLNGWQANNSPERLTHPLIRANGSFRQASWDEAMDLLVNKTRELQDKYTGHAIGFYNSGQLFLEEYYTLAIMGDAGVGTPHMDGNTRLCTATAALALMESFGTDGDPGSYDDFNVTDAIFHIGHNPAATQTVIWQRILDRRVGPNRRPFI